MAEPPEPSTDAPLFIVLNAGSGHNDAAATRGVIEGVLARAGREHRVLLVEDPQRLREIAAQAVAQARARDGVVVAAGGDGTINTVAQATLGSGCAFGVLPQGTFNYFGRAHGIPADTAAATLLLLTARAQPVQVGLVNERVFLVNASLGLYPQLLEDREAYKKQLGRSRPVAFAAGLMTLLREHRTLRLGIDLHGRTRDLRTPTLFVGNNALQMEQIGIPHAIEQGQLAAISLRPVGTLAMLWLLVRGALSKLGDADNVLCFDFRTLTVTVGLSPRRTRRGVKVATDGEVVRMAPPLVFSVSPEPLYLLKPEPGAA